MENILRGDREPEQEVICSEKNVTSICRGTIESDGAGLSDETAMESDSDLLDSLQSSSLEMLTNETVNSGAQASLSSCHKERSQGSPDTSSPRDSTQGIRDETLPDELETSHVEERPMDSETRHGEEEKDVPFKGLETSSDDTDEWETASEESVDHDHEPFDRDEVIEESCDQEDVGHLSPKTIDGDAGSRALETVSENAGLHSQESKNADLEIHGQEKHNEEAGTHGQGTVGGNVESHGQEIVSDAGLHSHEAPSEEVGIHDQVQHSKDEVCHGQETVSGETGLPSQETMSEETRLHGQEDVGFHSEDVGSYGHEMLSKDPIFPDREDGGIYGQETVSKDSESCDHEALSEDDSEVIGLPSHETVSEDTGPCSQEISEHGHNIIVEAEPHGHDAVIMEAEPHRHHAVGEDVWPHAQDTVSEEAEPCSPDIVGEGALLYDQETASKDEPDGHDTVGDDAHDHEPHDEDDELHSDVSSNDIAQPYVQETVSKDDEPHGLETVSEEAGPLGKETASEEDESHGDDARSYDHEPGEEDVELGHDSVNVGPNVSEDTGLHGPEIVSGEAGPHCQELASEETGPHGQEAVFEEAGPHGQEVVDEVDELHGLKSVNKEAEPLSHGGLGIEDREDTLHRQDTSDDDGPHGQETVNEKAKPPGQNLFSKEAETFDHELVGDLAQSITEEAIAEIVRTLGNETQEDINRPHGDYTEIQDNETVSGMEKFDADDETSLHKDNIIDAPDQALIDTMRTANNEITSDKYETSDPEENKMTDLVEIIETVKRETISDSTYDAGAGIGTFDEGTLYGDPFEMVIQGTDPAETQNIDMETVNEEALPVCEETFHEETQDVHLEGVDEENLDKGTDSHEMQDIYKETVGRCSLLETPVTVGSEIEDTIMVEISERIKEVLSGERTISEERARDRHKLTKASRVLDESPTNEEDGDAEQGLDLTNTFRKLMLTENIKITYVECEGLEEKLDSINPLIDTGEGPSQDLPNTMHQGSALELQYSTPVTTYEKSYMDCTMDTDTQLGSSLPPMLVEKRQEDLTKTTQHDYIRLIHTENELGLGYSDKPQFKEVTSDGQGMIKPCLQPSVLDIKQRTPSKDDPSTGLQNPSLGDPEPCREDMTTLDVLHFHKSPEFSQLDRSPEEVLWDEPDHYKLEIFPIRLKDIEILSKARAESGSASKTHDLLVKSIDSEYFTREEATQESVHQESHLHPVVVPDQDLVTPGLETAETSAPDLANITCVRRQRSNTDPCLVPDQEENLQASSNVEGSLKGRRRSLTPPCDKFTSSPPRTLEQTIPTVLNPMPDENRTSQSAKDTTKAKEYTFRPTQIFNPMILLGHTTEESGFYQEMEVKPSNVETTSQPSPQDNLVLQQNQNPERIVVDPRRSPKPAEGTSNTKPGSVPSVAPVWLPPHPTRYIGGVDRSVKTPENPLVRRATIRHKRSNVGTRPAAKRFSNASLPAIPQGDYPTGPATSNLPRIQSVNVSNIQIASRTKPSTHQQKIPEETGQARSSSTMGQLREEGHPALKENSPESVLRRGTRSRNNPPSSEPTQNIHRRYSTFINSSNLLYQEYSDVALNQEIQRQKPGDSPAEESQPSSPRVRRRILSSQDSYLQRLSISSADSLWQDIPKIRDSVTFLSMTRDEQKLQEAKFELIMSEALYLRSLNIAVDHFLRSTELQEVLSAQDRQWLFSRLSEVRDASSDFLFDLEEEFESNMYHFQVCDVVISHEPNFRRVYLPYVTNQSYQDRTFQRLMNDNPRFQQVVAKLESDPVCQRLTLKSFLILPFQRITRLRLLLQNILKRSAPGSTEELQATAAHNALEKLIRDCNGSVQRMKDTEELILLNQKIQFECKIFPLISQSRRLVKHGEVTSLEFNSMSFKWKVTTRPVYLHLFNDCLLMSRVREGGRFVVFDHASDFRVERCEIKLHTNSKNVFRVFLRDSAAMGRESSQEVREAEYIFRTETQSQKLRWICALSPPKEEIDFWRDQGLSQVQCLKSYKARENDELSLEKADILMLTQNSDDGWLRGIRLSDQQSGWFPQSHVQSISRNACLRNLAEEQRLQTARAKLQPSGAKGQ
ncbi:uncharacterized protein RB166_018253 [Leptodactylus fuscus]|uniref:uncharacterized protein LOC142219045 n=1 Tax=Leptodactylus fuscus TaxID=238119 RepID=UPI003F4E5D29